MSDTAITEYQDKLREFNRACSALKSVVGTVQVWSNHLNDFNNVMTIPDASAEPVARQFNPNKIILNIQNFPSPEQIHQAFDHFYQAKGDARRSYDSLSGAQKVGLQAPGECT